MSALDLHEMPVSAVLEEYNRLRTEKGMPLITSWKESKTKLLDAIARLDPVDLKKAERPIRRPSVKAEQTVKKPPKDSDSFTLADVARDHGIDPKVLRAKARRHAEQLGQYASGNEGWTFLNTHKSKVLGLLKLSKKDAA